jgi:hypothetical protein
VAITPEGAKHIDVTVHASFSRAASELIIGNY